MRKRDDRQVLTYLVRIETNDLHRAAAKIRCGQILTRICRLQFFRVDVWPVSKADVPKRKPLEPAELASGNPAETGDDLVTVG